MSRAVPERDPQPDPRIDTEDTPFKCLNKPLKTSTMSLWKEAGCTTELDYIEQTSWLLFLKYLDGLEQDRAHRGKAGPGEIRDSSSTSPTTGITGPRPRGRMASSNHNTAPHWRRPTRFVNQKLFPYLHGFKQKGQRAEHHRVQDRRNLRRDQEQDSAAATTCARSSTTSTSCASARRSEKHELSAPLRSQDQEHGQRRAQRRRVLHAAPADPRHGAGGQAPRIGERIYDGACGSAGFLCESFEYLTSKRTLTTKDLKILQERTFHGKEKKANGIGSGGSRTGRSAILHLPIHLWFSAVHRRPILGFVNTVVPTTRLSGLADVEAGRVTPFEEFEKEFRKKHGLSRRSR